MVAIKESQTSSNLGLSCATKVACKLKLQTVTLCTRKNKSSCNYLSKTAYLVKWLEKANNITHTSKMQDGTFKRALNIGNQRTLKKCTTTL